MAEHNKQPNIQVNGATPYYSKGGENGVPYQGPPADLSSVSKKNTRAYKDILIAGLVVSVPMALLTAILLGLIFTHRVSQSNSVIAVSGNSQSSSSAYLVDFGATRLLTIASLTSSVAPFLPGFIMTLLSFPAAKKVLAGDSKNLPTPYQLGLYLQLLTAGLGSLYQWIKYKKWGRLEKQSSAVTLLVIGLSLVTLIGYLILAADTWLHVVTSTVIYHHVTASPSSQPANNYGRGFYSDKCKERLSEIDTCSVYHSASSSFLTNSREAYATLNNLSTVNRVGTFEYEGRSHAYILPADARPTIDYRASTFALSTVCTPATRACNMEAAFGASTPFNCSPAFSGDVTSGRQPIHTVYLKDSTGQENQTYSLDMNPFFIGTWANVDSSGQIAGANNTGNLTAEEEALANDPDIVHPVHGGSAWVLNCTAAVFDLTYTMANGSLKDAVLTLSNGTAAGVIASPSANGYYIPALSVNAKIASFSRSANDLATKWAALYSQMALALSTGVMSPRANILEQSRQEKLVARVPKAPLFVLCILNLLYAALGIVLAVYALVFTRVGSGTGAAVQRLTIPGLVADRFEPAERAVLGGNKHEEFFVEREGRGGAGRVGLGTGPSGGLVFGRS